jgi:hypothetical protein
VQRSGKARADAVAQGFAVDGFALECGFGSFHYGAHLLNGSGAGFCDGFGDGGVHFGVAGAGGEVGLDDGELFSLFLGKVVAVAFGELIDGFFALLDEGLQELDGFGLVELAKLFCFFVGDGGFDHAEDAKAELVFGAHGVGEIFLDFFGESHGDEYSRGGERVDSRQSIVKEKSKKEERKDNAETQSTLRIRREEEDRKRN